jgi:Pvc16 N-terminal domain
VAGAAAIATTSLAIVGLLEAAATSDPELVGVHFEVARLDDLRDLEQPTATLLLQSVEFAPPSVADLPPRPPPRVPRLSVALELRYRLAARSPDPVDEQRLLGWCIGTLADSPLLTAAWLNSFVSGADVFDPDESVEIIPDVASAADSRHASSASVAYLARTIFLGPLSAGG